MAVAETERVVLRPAAAGIWQLDGLGLRGVKAGLVDRHGTLPQLHAHVASARRWVQAEQVHGSSVAILQHPREEAPLIPACDALLTNVLGTALLVRTADCLPLFFIDPSRGAVGIAHAGWRGLHRQLPLRVLAAFRHLYQSHPANLRVAVGPAIRACCYEVGPEFQARFGVFVQERRGRRTCDLVGVALDQLRRGGIRPDHLFDAQACTACESDRWFSIRREGAQTGRMVSFMLLGGSRSGQ